MTEESELEQTVEVIERLQQSYSNIKIFTAVPMGVLLIIYFFTFAQLIDKGMNAALWFEIITSVLFVLYFIFINQAAFVILKLLKGNKPEYRQVLSVIKVADLSMKPDALSEIIESRR